IAGRAGHARDVHQPAHQGAVVADQVVVVHALAEVLELPAEQAGVEGLRRLGVGDAEIEPGAGAGAAGHRSSCGAVDPWGPGAPNLEGARRRGLSDPAHLSGGRGSAGRRAEAAAPPARLRRTRASPRPAPRAGPGAPPPAAAPAPACPAGPHARAPRSRAGTAPPRTWADRRRARRRRARPRAAARSVPAADTSPPTPRRRHAAAPPRAATGARG